MAEKQEMASRRVSDEVNDESRSRVQTDKGGGVEHRDTRRPFLISYAKTTLLSTTASPTKRGGGKRLDWVSLNDLTRKSVFRNQLVCLIKSGTRISYPKS